MLHAPPVTRPSPVIEIVCGLPGALSVTKIVPFSVPEVLGVKVTLIWQLPPDARPGTQLSVSPKLALAVMLATLSIAVP